MENNKFMERKDLTDFQREGIALLKEIDSIFSSNDIWYSLSYGSALGAIRENGFIPWDRDIDIVIMHKQKKRVREALQNSLSVKYRLISCDSDTVLAFDLVTIEGVPEKQMHVDLYPLIGIDREDEKGFRFQKYCRKINKVFACKYLNTDRIQKRWKIPIVYLIRAIEYIIPNKLFRKYIEYLSTRYDIDKVQFCFPFSNDGKRGEIMPKELVMNTKKVRFETLMLPVPENYDRYLRRLYGDDYMTPKQY